MADVLTLDLVDRDGAIREAMDEGLSGSRRDLFKRLAGGGAVLSGGLLIGGLPKVALGAPSARQDVAILNFALLLEHLEAEFYKEAVALGGFGGEVGRFARVVRDHEITHVRFLRGALGDAARPKPTFDFGDTTTDQATFQATAQALEDTGVAAYNGQGTRLRRQTLGAAASIVSVEARHAAWIRRINNGPRYSGGSREYPAPRAFDRAKTKRQIERAVAATGFIQSA